MGLPALILGAAMATCLRRAAAEGGSPVSATVCLLSPAPLWVSPRLRKEADALFAAGYDVVVGYRADGETTRDDELLSRKPWRWHRVDVARRRSQARWARAAARQRGAELAVRAGVAAARRAAYCRADNALYDWAVSSASGTYIAHTQPVLAVAADAARRTGAAFAFDCEDLLAEEERRTAGARHGGGK